jgi:hypothetical protein
MDIVAFLCHDGKPPDAAEESPSPETTFAGFRDGYLTTIGSVAVEKNTIRRRKVTRTARSTAKRGTLLRTLEVRYAASSQP